MLDMFRSILTSFRFCFVLFFSNRSLIQCKYVPHFLRQQFEDSSADPLPEKMRESVVRPFLSLFSVQSSLPSIFPAEEPLKYSPLVI